VNKRDLRNNASASPGRLEKNPEFEKRMLDILSGILVELLVSNGEIMLSKSVYGKFQ
jgi:hypothetical protein